MAGSIKTEMNNYKEKYYCLAKLPKVCSRYFVLLFIGLNIVASASASTADTTESSILNHQIWIDFYPHYYFNKKLEYYGDAGYRTIVSERNWSRLYVRPSIKYHLNKTWELHAGIGFFYTFYNKDVDQFEIRPWQGVQLNWPKWEKVGFKNLLRFEERMSFLTEDWILDFEFRLRYKLSGKYDFHERWFVALYGEYFLPVTGEIKELYRNRGRAGIELGYKPAKEWQLSFVLNWQGSRSGPDEELHSSDYIYQLRVRKVWHRIIQKKHSSK